MIFKRVIDMIPLASSPWFYWGHFLCSDENRWLKTSDQSFCFKHLLLVYGSLFQDGSQL